MKKIYKYTLETTDFQTVEMPKDCKILCVQTQNERPCIWALIDDMETIMEIKKFWIFWTGHPIGIKNDPELHKRYIGTYQLLGGKFIGHVFEE